MHQVVVRRLLFATQISSAKLRHANKSLTNHNIQRCMSLISGRHLPHPHSWVAGIGMASLDFIAKSTSRVLTPNTPYKRKSLVKSKASLDVFQREESECFEGFHVVLFGWLGAQPKYLEKYADLWRSRGATVLPYTPPITATLFPFQADRSIVDFSRCKSEQLEQAALAADHQQQQQQQLQGGEGAAPDNVGQLVMAEEQHQGPKRKLVYHVFSNGGFIFLGGLIRATQMGLVPKSILGEPSAIIIDSAPGEINKDMAARGVGAAVMKEGSQGFEERFPLLVTLSNSLFNLYLNLPPIKNRIKEVRQAWEEHSPTCPQLFLFSEEDVLIPPEDIENFMAIQQNRGIEVSSNKWADTVHVEHYREYPEEYVAELKQFINNLE